METFRLWCDDFRPHNVLCNEYGDVVGVIDWELVYLAPESHVYDPPHWLIQDRQFVALKPDEDRLDDGQEDGSTSEQQNLASRSGDVGSQEEHERVADTNSAAQSSGTGFAASPRWTKTPNAIARCSCAQCS